MKPLSIPCETERSLTEFPFRIKDLMLGELLCQSGILTDDKMLELIGMARAAQSSFGSVLVFATILTPSQLFVARRLVNRYIQDSDNADYYVSEVQKLIRGTPAVQSTRQAQIIKSSLALRSRLGKKYKKISLSSAPAVSSPLPTRMVS